MKTLNLHCDYINFKALKKALKSVDEIAPNQKLEGEAKDCLVVLTAIEKGDTKESVGKLVENIKDIAEKVQTKNIVLYPYAHLSSNLGSPATAVQILNDAAKSLKGFKVTQAPFGYYKQFEMKVKGHPLSELSREIISGKNGEGESMDAKMETSCHLVYETARKMLGEEFVSISEVDGNKATLNWSNLKKDLDDKFISKLEKEANKNLEKDLSVTIESLERKKALDKCGKFYDDVVPKKFKELRVVSIEGLPPEPCIKPHVSSTKEIGGEIKINGFEKVGEDSYKIKITLEGGREEAAELSESERARLLRDVSRAKLDTSKLKDNDHRIIGSKLDLWSFNNVAPGMPFWHPKGLHLKNKLIEYWREMHRKSGYEEISTPQIMDKKLWEISGHWRLYKENMFTTDYEKREFAVKPMNCPGGMIVYKTSPKSYKDLPLRVGELGVVHRQELSGVLAGLFRVIQFTQDDAHIFCTKDQLHQEIVQVIKLFQEMLGRFGFKKYRYTISVRSEEKKNKYLGDDKSWETAEGALAKGLDELGVKYSIEPGEAKFYGPSLDVQVEDSLGREWQCSTLQLDFALPERFNITYNDKKGKDKIPFMLHRVVYGSLDRFIGVLTEHVDGKFPMWMSPNQIKVMTLNDDVKGYANEIYQKLFDEGFETELNDKSESMGKKARDAQVQRFNYLVTVGEKEKAKGKIAVRARDSKEITTMTVKKFIEKVKAEIRERR